MTALRSTQALGQEHEVIQRVVAAVSLTADRIEQSHTTDWTLVSNIGEFLREYADHLHHAKEERSLFPLLEARGVPASGCPLGALRHEHQAGRALVAELNGLAAAKGDDDPRREQLISALRSIVKLYVEHMWKEDYLLIPMSGKVLSTADDDTVVREFENINAAFGEAERRRFEDFAASLEQHIVEAGATT